MLLLKVSRCCTCMHRYLFACQYSTTLSLQQKKKWKVKDIMMLANWKQECDSLFGPVIKPHKALSSNAKTKKSSGNGSGIVASVPEHQQDSYEGDLFCDILPDQKPLVDWESIDAGKSVTSGQNSYQGGSDFVNYSEIKVLTLSELEMHQTDQNVSEKLTAKPDHVTKPQVQEDGMTLPCRDDLSNADDVCEYQWVEKLPDQIFNKASGTKSSISGAYAMTNSELQSDGKIANIMVNQRYSSADSPIFEAVKKKDFGTGIVTGSDESTISSDEQNASELSATTQKYISEQSESADKIITSFPLFLVDKNKNLSEISNANHAQTTRLPSVTKILKATQSSESKLALERWEKQMILQLGAEGFAKYKEDLFKNGANFHANIELFLTGRQEMIKVLPAIEGHWQSVEAVINEVTSVQCVEQPIRHSQLGYCGVIDCVAEYRGEMCVIEWKTSERRKSNIKFTYDNPVQLAAYLGAYNFQPGSHLQVERCLLVIGYDDGNAADVHVMNKRDCLLYWKEWLQRLSAYRRLNS